MLSLTLQALHGLKIKGGMSKVQDEEKRAVDAGYWNMFRFNPLAEKKFTLDSKAPTMDYQEFLDGEVRYLSLKLKNPERAAKLYKEAAEHDSEQIR